MAKHSSLSAGRLNGAVLFSVLFLSACSSPPDASQSSTGSPAQTVAGSLPEEATRPVSQAAGSVQDRLTIWLKLVGTSHAPVQDYADFLNTRPVWPRWQLIKLRMQQALAQENDPAALKQLCAEQPLTYGPALAHCSTQVGNAVAGLPARLSAQARQAWMNGNDTAQAATALTSNFSQALTPEASWLRFNRQEKSGLLAAARQTVPYLSGNRQKVALARLAFRAGDASAESQISGLSGSDLADPLLVLDHARWLRSQKRYDDALALWKSDAAKAEVTTSLAAFWHERDALARELLEISRDADAFSVAHDTSLIGVNKLDAAFLCGWIALEKQKNPTVAEPFFRELADSPALITRSRGYYWLGRAHTLSQNSESARADYLRAASDAGTFYGQMAAAELDGQRPTLSSQQDVPTITIRALKAASSPHTASATGARLSQSDLVQAAQILVSQGDYAHARDFLNLLALQVVTMSDKLALVSLSTQLQIPDVGVALSRQLGKNGIFLLHEGWPAPYSLPANTLPSGLVLGLMRQESSFNPDAVSSSNAIGLMQLKPSTAGDMLRKADLPASAATASGLHNPDNNIRLGIAYLEHMQERFGPVVPYIAAAYNGGPGRLGRWLASSGNPVANNASQFEMIDWIESIPYSETRNYVQRVWENMTIYRVMEQSK